MSIMSIINSIAYANGELKKLIHDNPFETKEKLIELDPRIAKRYIKQCDRRIDKLFKKAKPWFEEVTNANVALKIKEGKLTKQKVIRMYQNEHKK